MTGRLGLVAAALTIFTSQVFACDFARAKTEIDKVLELDPKLAARFREQVGAGDDPVKVLSDLVDREVREQIDACRWESAEYLTKKGFAPAH